MQKAVGEAGGESLLLFHFYAPAEKAARLAFFKKLAVCGGGGGQQVLIGDFSCITEPRDRKAVGGEGE